MAAPRVFARLTARASGACARSLYLPLFVRARALRTRVRELRGVAAKRKSERKTNLPVVAWSDLFPARPIYLSATRQRLGNVTIGELAVLATAAAAAPPDREIVEIGTFDGRTTLNLAINAPGHAPVVTLDLPPEMATRFELAEGERMFVDKPRPGECFRNAAPEWAGAAARISQVFGDSAVYDWSQHIGKAGLVFVDGSHAYDYAIADSNTALRLVANKGVVMWHDYGVWDGVTRALEELEADNHFGLRHVRGTTLVVFKA